MQAKAEGKKKQDVIAQVSGRFIMREHNKAHHQPVIVKSDGLCAFSYAASDGQLPPLCKRQGDDRINSQDIVLPAASHTLHMTNSC